ncbi:MAG TPA: response regulator transcription factor [Candidatus Acidoferrales bacterium]|jgi:DNA-binding NarL/FixJ family response regulator|nr:response regulator transcription factor [Candidatus Acidoferrales bacterium]
MLNLAAQVTRLKSRILLVDDHELVRDGIACLLENEPELEICGQAANGQEAIQKVSELKPDLVLLDLGMPIMGGTQAARQIRKLAPDIKIVFLSMHDSDTIEQLSKLIEVDAYLTKGCSREKLKKTIRSVLSAHH